MAIVKVLPALTALGAAFALTSAPACSQSASERAEICPDGYDALSENDAGRAVEAFEACLNARQYDWPVEAELRLRLGSAHLGLEQGREALIAFNRIFALIEDQGGNADNPLLRRNRAVAYLQLERPADAIEDLEIAAAGVPDDAFTHVLLGSAHMDLEQHAEAVETFDRAVRAEPGFLSGWVGRSAAFIELGMYERAVQDAREAVAIEPESPDALNALCWALVNDGRAAQGLSLCEQAVEADPDSGAIVHSLASALEQVGREREARRLFARAYELDPDSDTIAEDYERTH
ncbi:tetratricopeptide repeat protein [Marinicauda sp. Alg238-R41]|uniref:tetratricopeptide repeat protein n=1 Tax=Marinicauda sp. Alg238-R41 TaxID=2993447 RepID=UPI0022DF91EE|nr:tetratricopeptide repeat protein [Marinicauda sp. Alg238-R41]